MPVAGPSYRRPRSSAGPLELGNPSVIGSVTQPAVDADFRRRHSRQNKEIIQENVKHKAALRALQDEITQLRDELVEVKAENRRLSIQMRNMKYGGAALANTDSLEVIDQILAALPALRILRDKLSDPALMPMDCEGQIANTTKPTIIPMVTATIATRPAATAAGLLQLPRLGERDEDDWQDVKGAQMVSPVINTEIQRSKGRPSLTASKSMPRSPIPPGLTNLLPISTGDRSSSSPSSSESPTPITRKRISPSKAKRRRESGLLKPISIITPQNKTVRRRDIMANDTLVVPIADEAERTVVGSQESSKASSSSEISAEPTEGEVPYNSLSNSDLASSHVAASIEPMDNRRVQGKGKRRATIAGSAVEHKVTQKEENPASEGTDSTALHCDFNMPPDSQSSTSSNALSAFSELSLDEEGPRGRRVRKSVNYKEPSLAKKMRKPDGVSVEETLGIASRGAQAAGENGLITQLHATLGGTRRKSVLPKSTRRQVVAVSHSLADSSAEEEETVETLSEDKEAEVAAVLGGDNEGSSTLADSDSTLTSISSRASRAEDISSTSSSSTLDTTESDSQTSSIHLHHNTAQDGPLSDETMTYSLSPNSVPPSRKAVTMMSSFKPASSATRISPRKHIVSKASFGSTSKVSDKSSGRRQPSIAPKPSHLKISKADSTQAPAKSRGVLNDLIDGNEVPPIGKKIESGKDRSTLNRDCFSRVER